VFQAGSSESGEIVFTAPFFSPPKACEGGEKRKRRKQCPQILGITLHKFLGGASKIKYLFLTHHHDDHAGFAAELVRSIGCQVIAHRNALLPLKQGKSEGTDNPVNRPIRIVLAFYTLFHREYAFPPLTLTDRDILIDGDNDSLLKGIGIDGVILHTPGHTSDSISVLLSDGSAFVGDAAMNFLRWTGVGRRPIVIEDIDTVYESWRKLRERGARLIYPSHGRPFSAKRLVPVY